MAFSTVGYIGFSAAIKLNQLLFTVFSSATFAICILVA
jgi:hypothetical protein